MRKTKNTGSPEKRARAKEAEAWLLKLEKDYSNYLIDAIYGTTAVHNTAEYLQKLIGRELDSEQSTVVTAYKNDAVSCIVAAHNHAKEGDRICVLNYASYKHPGGGFLSGAKSQEEDLCRESGLFHCLVSQHAWYKAHRLESTACTYTDDFIYSKDVPFIRNGKVYLTDVLTMAAPNACDTDYDFNDIFEKRMSIAYRIPACNDCNVVLLGAWGCGVFGNDPKFVAGTWMKMTKRWPHLYREVVHPVKDERVFRVFKDVILGRSNAE